MSVPNAAGLGAFENGGMSMDYEKMSDKELDAMVASRVMGKEPEIVWIARADDGKPDAEASAFLYTDSRFDSIIRSRDQIEKWIAEHPVVFGEKIILGKWLKHAPYTTDPSAWWEAVEKMRADNIHPIIESMQNFTGKWTCVFYADANGGYGARIGMHDDKSIGRAICIAALRALDAQAGGA